MLPIGSTETSNIKLGSQDVSSVMLGSTLVWTRAKGFWSFTSQSSTLSNLVIITNPIGNIRIDWGDNTPVTIASSGQAVSHSYV